MTYDLKQSCNICKGLGFDKGKICICITKKRDPLKDIFGDIFSDASFDNIMKDFIKKPKG